MNHHDHMRASEAYAEAAERVNEAAGLLAHLKPNQLRKAIDQFDLLIDAFEKFPETWTCGTFASKHDHAVCSVGMLRMGYRKRAGLTEKLATVPTISTKAVLNDFIIRVNDSFAWHAPMPPLTMGPKNIVRVYRIIADGLRQVLALKEQGVTVRSNDVDRIVGGALRRAATKAAWNSKNKIALVK